jgi:hypothetical protein
MAYIGQRVTFTCIVNIVVNRPINTTWRTEDYIGSGSDDVLQLRSNDSVGTTVNKSTTVVTLIRSTRSKTGLITVETELQLTADARYPISRVSCMANGGPIHGVTFFTSRSSLPGNAC